MEKILITFILFLFSLCTKAQEYNYFHYDIKDGLSGITVYTIAQDKDGFLWFGTETGLSRFDGSHFKNYATADGLHDKEIINLFVDSKNRVWIFPFKNTIYYYYQGKIHNVQNDSLLKKFSVKDEIFKACEDKDGNIIFMESDRIHILNKNDGLKEVNKIENGNFFNTEGIAANGNCNLFVSSFNYIKKRLIFQYEYKNSKFSLSAAIPDYNFSRNTSEINPYYTILRDQASFQIHDDNKNQTTVLKIPERFHTLSYVNDSLFTISTLEKTYLFNVQEKQITDSFLNFRTINKCFQDNEGNIWFATMAHGVYRLSSRRFKVYNIGINSSSVAVHALKMLNDNLLIGSTRNILLSLNTFTKKSGEIRLNTNYDIKRVYSITDLDSNTTIIGTDNGLFIKDKNHIKNYFPGVVIKNVFTHNDSILFAADRIALDFSTKNLNKVDTIWYGRSVCAAKVNDKFYIGTLSGLFYINTINTHNAICLGNKYPFLKNKIVALAIDANKNLWVAVENYGLVCLQNNNVRYAVTEKSGLISNVCRCLFIDKNVLWLGTDKGISKIDISHYPFNITNYTAADGLDCEIINCIYAKGDSVFAGTPFGLTFFKANEIQNQSLCKLKLTGVKSSYRDWYNNTDSINLKASNDYISFEYAGISFLSEGDITYYYQLNGLDTTWQSTKENSIEFERLPAGDYTFSVYAVNKYGVKSKTISVAFTKAKHIWQLWWVQGLALILIGLSIWLTVRQRIKAIRKSANQKVLHERKIHELEQMALRAQMNPHFIFNSLNSIQQYVFSGNVVEANQFITNFSSLIRQTLYISGKKFITVSEEIKYLESYLMIEQAKYENIFDFKIQTSNEIATEDLSVPPLILQPYIENSIRHGVLNLSGRKGKIIICFYVKNDELVCVVKDNGIGREASTLLKQNANSEHKSKGMELVQKRVESLNTIYNVFISVSIEDILNANETGTCVTIKFPLSYG